ncbi:FAD-dependent oxidoreductase [Pseudooceanicola sp. CBS1P-1]|nr:FAD-dependent oxidoreductase [Pseudooceanicola endophyticus]
MGTPGRRGIIGGAVIGVSTALTLLKDGHAVTLFDRAGICAGASQGNAGAFALTDVTPMAAPYAATRF